MMKRLAIGLVAGLAGGALAAEGGGKGALPLREVILYSSGVGYFERAGEVNGDASVELRFRSGEINDLLKSMVVQDLGGGTVGAITYDSRDPISKTLGSFAINLTSNPSLREILNQMRGEKVNVSWPGQASGIILGVEEREVADQDDETRNEFFLNLFSDGALKSIPISQINEIKLVSQDLQKELNEALAVLAKGHDTEKKTVTLEFDGEGKRQVNVAYLAEAPVWKTSYRLVLGEDDAFLQGWAIVENTGGDDWENVQLSLVSGRPISFRMDLYQPLYAPRPEVQPELYLSLRPQVYGDSLALPEGEAMQESLARRERLAADSVGFQGGTAPTTLGLTVQRRGLAAKALAAPPAAAAAAFGAGGGFGDLTGTGAVAAGAETGELFQYVLNMPVSIQRQKSAMLPIITEKIQGTKLSIYNENVQSKHPLNGYRLTNTTELHIMQGPITVFDGGSYAGDARIEDIAPKQDRLISYALDLKVEVEPQSKSEPVTLVSVRINRGTFLATRKIVEEKTYTVRNKDSKSKTVVIEHPFRPDYTLETPSDPTERTRELYRFNLPLEPGQTEKLLVRESRQYVEETLVTDLFGNDYHAFYLRSDKVSERVKEALRKVGQFRENIAQLAADRKLREDRMKEIGQEQARIRENMARLAQNSELYQRYVRKFDEQETEFEHLRDEANRLQERESALQRELNEYLSQLELN